MKKKILAIVAVVALAVIMCVTLVACNADKYLVSLAKQSDILRELRSKTIDIGIMDKTMAKHYVEEDDSLMMIEDLTLKDEEYGVGFRKGSKGFADKVNVEIAKLYKSGYILDLAKKYNIEEQMVESYDYTSVWDTLTDADKEDYNKIVAKGEVVIGYTIYEPMAKNETVGFDVELPRKVFEALGLKVKFQEINWDNKFIELSGGNIDVIWNGMTVTDKVKENTEYTKAYLVNSQVALILKSNKDKYTKDINTFTGAYIGVEKGSAGELAYEDAVKPITQPK